MICPAHETHTHTQTHSSLKISAMEVPKDHVIMLPFMAQGHLIPFLSLAKQLQQRTNFTITIVNTQLNITYLRKTISTHPLPPSTPPINLVSLPFDTTNKGLPTGSENTEGLSITQLIKFLHASTSLESPFRCFIADMVVANGGCPPVCLISDVFMGWANDVAKSFNTINIAFTTTGAYGTAAFLSIWKNLPHRIISTGGLLDNFTPPGFPLSCRFEISHLHQFVRAADGTDEWSTFFQRQITLSLQSFGMLCNTVKEIEPLGFQALKNCTNIPIWCIGPLLPSSITSGLTRTPIEQRTGRVPGMDPQKCIEWLDKHPQRTVLLISFGSQNSISQTQMMELANGLEDSKKPFIWAIRPPLGFDPKSEFKPEWLPPGFEERSKGLLIHKWAPQLEILCHRSIGAFLSHCGWNSVLESLSQGVPIIGWPLAAEQAYNSKMMVEEMGVCVELVRGLHSQFGREDVRRVVDLVMDKSVNGKGEEMRRKGAEIGNMIRAAVKDENCIKGSFPQAMDDFVSAVLANYNS